MAFRSYRRDGQCFTIKLFEAELTRFIGNIRLTVLEYYVTLLTATWVALSMIRPVSVLCCLEALKNIKMRERESKILFISKNKGHPFIGCPVKPPN
jgi:hypothetical protein